MRGILISPAQIPLLILCEDPNPLLFDQTLAAWGACSPQALEGLSKEQISQGQVAGSLETQQPIQGLLVISRREAGQIQADYPPALNPAAIESSSPAYAAERLTVQVTLQILKARAGRSHLFHAASLGLPAHQQQGAADQPLPALALVAPSGTGKTTATRFLGQQLSYLSDETALIDPSSLLITPYPKPLSIIEEESQPKVQYNPADLGLLPAHPQESYRLEHLVILNRVKDQKVAPSCRRLDLASALFALILQTSGVQEMPQGLGELAALINRLGGAIEVTYSEISQTLPLFKDLLTGRLDLETRQDSYRFEPSSHHQQGLDRGERFYQRAAGSQGLEIGEDYLISSKGQLNRVSLIGWDIWSALSQPLGGRALYQVMKDLYGQVPHQDFKATLEAMEKAHLIESVYGLEG